MFKSATSAASVSEMAAARDAGGGWSPAQLLFAAALLGLAAAGASLADVSVARYFQTHRLPGELSRLIRLAEVFGYGGTVALIIVTALALDRRGWSVAARLAAGGYG